jgi:hypothetical protein
MSVWFSVTYLGPTPNHISLPQRISQVIIEFETRRSNDESLRKMVDELEEDLSKRANKKYFIPIAWHHVPSQALI